MSTSRPYRYEKHPHIIDFTWSVEDGEGERELVASGTCPVCSCPMTCRYGATQTVVPKGGGFRGRRADPGPGPWHTRCRCEGYHQPRPADGYGCGAWLALAPPPSHLVGGG